MPFLHQIFISNKANTKVCSVQNVKGEWESELRDGKNSANRLVFEELKHQILAPNAEAGNANICATKISEKTFSSAKIFRPNLKDDKGQTLLYLVV